MVVMLTATLLSPRLSLAQDNTVAAKAHYETGVRHFDLSEYEQALADFKEAYRNKPDPVFLFNIGQCHRKLGHTDEAITFYQTYLRRAPEAKNRDEVERRIAELESLRDAEHASIANATAPTPKRSPTSTGAQEKAAARATATPTATAALDFNAHDDRVQTPHSSIYTRWWFWTVVGGVAAGTATVAVIMATRDPTKIPSSGLGAQRAMP